MKYRIDFVTNSSSSSFFVTFGNAKEMRTQLAALAKAYPEYAEIVSKDVENHKITYTEALKEYISYLETEVEHSLFMEFLDTHKNQSINAWLEYKESKGYRRKVNQLIGKDVELFKNAVNHRGIFAVLNYSDNTKEGSDLEHMIMPYAGFTVKTFNLH